ncbi:MAG: hypothetical protein II306_06525 [Clostridia bacterium]|nr:hypothetical protein [Clostridia bacterium]
MKLTITKDLEDIEIVPEQFKNEKNPPKFIFRCPNSADVLNFIWGGNQIDEAIFNCFIGFENKIELEDEKGKKIDYSTYEEFIKIGLSPEIALIHNQIRNEIATKLNHLIQEAKNTEKK